MITLFTFVGNQRLCQGKTHWKNLIEKTEEYCITLLGKPFAL